MEGSDIRFISHNFVDYHDKVINIETYKKETFNLLKESLEAFYKNVSPSETKAICSLVKKSRTDYRVGGNLIVYLKMHELSNIVKTEKNEFFSSIEKEKLFSHNYLLDAEKCFDSLKGLFSKDLSSPKRLEISYYFSGAGINLYGAVLYYCKGDNNLFKSCVQSILQYKEVLLKNKTKIYYEVLYGVPGYLYVLLELQKRFQFANNIPVEFKINLEKDVFELVELIIKEGVNNYFQKTYDLQKLNTEKLPNSFRLVYTFHEKEYLGGAHGLFGVLSMLLQAYSMNQTFFKKNIEFNNIFNALVQKSCEFAITLQMKSGNFPSSLKRKTSDRLVQFCHGSTGAVFPLLLASKVCIDSRNDFTENAIKGGENLWLFGILKKGYGICHGISGNAYSLLSLYRYTNDKKWLYRAMMFALAKKNEQIMDIIDNYEYEDRYAIGSSDYPFSFMQGLSGDISLLIDLLNPVDGRFPGYEVL